MSKIAVLLLSATLILGLSGPASADSFLGKLFGGNAIKGSGDLVTQPRDVPEFNKIRTSGAFDVFVTIGSSQSLEVTFDDNLVDFIKTEVKGKTLRLYSDESYRSSRGCKIVVTVPSLEAISASGSGDFEIDNLTGDYFEYNISGSGDLTVNGEVTDLEISVSGSGDVDAKNLKAENAWVQISGSGDVEVYAGRSLNCSVAGSGDIRYYGEPTDISRSVSGSGSIRAR